MATEQGSIRINPQVRTCCTWTTAGPESPLEVTLYHLAVSIGIRPRRINEIVHGKRRVTAESALRPGPLLRHHRRVLAQPADRYDLEIGKDHLGATLDQIHTLQSL